MLKKFPKTYIYATLGVVAYYLVMSQLFEFSCIAMLLFGLPCPGCGMTRAAWLFVTGNFANSFAMHPLLVPVGLFAAFAFVWWIKGKNTEKLKTPFIVLLVIFVAVYIVRMILLFPHQEPLVANPDSLLHNVINLLTGGN